MEGCQRVIEVSHGIRFYAKSIYVTKMLEELFHIIAFVVLTLLHSERPKFYRILAVLSAIGLKSLKCQGLAQQWL